MQIYKNTQISDPFIYGGHLIKCKYNHCQSGHTITPYQWSAAYTGENRKQYTLDLHLHLLQALGTISFDSTKSISFVGKISEGIENGLRSFPNVLLPTISINSSSMLGFPAEHSQNSFDSCISISHFKISPKCTNPYLPKPANPESTSQL